MGTVARLHREKVILVGKAVKGSLTIPKFYLFVQYKMLPTTHPSISGSSTSIPSNPSTVGKISSNDASPVTIPGTVTPGQLMKAGTLHTQCNC